MILIIVAVLSIIIGLVRKGSFANILDSGIKAWFLFVISLLLFVAIRVGDGMNVTIIQNLSYILLLAAYALLLLGVILNLNNIWMFALLIGTVMNFVVVFINGGKMPISPNMLSVVGIAERTISQSSVMSVATGSTSLSFLGGIIPIPLPSIFAEVISPGTVIIAVGFFMLIQNLLLGVVYEYEDDDDDDDDYYDDYEEEKLSRKERKEQKRLQREQQYDDEDDDEKEDQKDYTSGNIDIHNAPGVGNGELQAEKSDSDLIDDILYSAEDKPEDTMSQPDEKEMSLKDIAESENPEDYDDSIEDDFTAVFDTTELSAIRDEVNEAAGEEEVPLDDDFAFDELSEDYEITQDENIEKEPAEEIAEALPQDEMETLAEELTMAEEPSEPEAENNTSAEEFFNEFEETDMQETLSEDLPLDINEELTEELTEEPPAFVPIEEEFDEEPEPDLNVSSEALTKAIEIFDEIPQKKEDIKEALADNESDTGDVDTDSPFVIVNGRIVENPYYKFRKGNKENIVTEDESITPGINEVKTRSSAAGRPSFTPPNIQTESSEGYKVSEEQPMGYEKVEMKIGDVKIKFWKKDNEEDNTFADTDDTKE